MVAIGVHYLPFMFLYGTCQFDLLGGLMLGGGTALLMLRHDLFITGGWFTAIVLLVFSVILWQVYQRERATAGAKLSQPV